MAALGLSQFVSALTHQEDHTLDLIFTSGITVNRINTDVVPCLDHLALKAWLSTPNLPCLGSIYAHQRSVMDPSSLQKALWDPIPPGVSLDELVEDWQSRPSEAINKTAHRCPLPPHTKLAPWYSPELRQTKLRAKAAREKVATSL